MSLFAGEPSSSSLSGTQDQDQDDPITREMKRLNSAATLSDLPEVSTPEAARECLGSYRKADEKDKTVIILDELLNVLPEDEEGKGNLICDIIARHRNNQLQELAEEIRTSLLVPCKLLSDTCHPSDI